LTWIKTFLQDNPEVGPGFIRGLMGAPGIVGDLARALNALTVIGERVVDQQNQDAQVIDPITQAFFEGGGLFGDPLPPVNEDAF